MNKIEKICYKIFSNCYLLGVMCISFTSIVVFCKLILEDSKLNIFVLSFISICWIIGTASFLGKNMMEEYFNVKQEVKEK